MIGDLNELVGAVFQALTQVWELYTQELLLTMALALWVVRKIVKIFKKL